MHMLTSLQLYSSYASTGKLLWVHDSAFNSHVVYLIEEAMKRGAANNTNSPLNSMENVFRRITDSMMEVGVAPRLCNPHA